MEHGQRILVKVLRLSLSAQGNLREVDDIMKIVEDSQHPWSVKDAAVFAWRASVSHEISNPELLLSFVTDKSL